MSNIYYDRNELADWELEIEDAFQDALKEWRLQVHYHGDRSQELREESTRA